MAIAPLSATAASYNACKTGGSANPRNIYFAALNSGDQVICQDKLYTLGDPKDLKKANNLSENSDGGFLSFEWSENGIPDPFYTDDEFLMVTNFQPSLKGTDGLRNTGSFRYALAATLPGFSLNSADLDSVISRKSTSKDTTVIKTIYDLSLYPIGINPDTIDIGSLFPLVTLTSLNGVNIAPQPLNGATQILVIDSWNIASQDRLTNYQNSFTQTYTATPPEDTAAPGPLPLMGAGAAFGFSRRMRHRLGQAARD